MLNSAEHEICPTNKSQITNNCKFFLAKHSKQENLPADKYVHANYCWHFIATDKRGYPDINFLISP